jgi:amino acid permease
MSLSSESRDYLARNVLRTLLVLSTVTVAIKAPYFGNMLGSVGGLTDAVQCFVFPPMIFLKLEGDKLSVWYRSVCRLTIVWGVFIIGYTMTNILLPIFESS